MQARVGNDRRIAIIGAGPAGLVAARWLARHGCKPVLFEAAARLGGQWNPDGAASATWPGMRTNTSRTLSRFSDLDHDADVPLFPRREQMLSYLERYAEEFGLLPCLRLSTRVTAIERSQEGWAIQYDGSEGPAVETFAKIVLACGAEGVPLTPEIPGLDRFTGALGAIHSAQYHGADRYRGRSVLVAGCSISALEIASELALAGAASVTASYRRQRYVLPKIIAGVPTDHIMFTRAAALAGAQLPPDRLAMEIKSMVTRAAGRPDQFGAPAADENIFAAGITQAQHFLPAIAEGRITVRPWIQRVEGKDVVFDDGSRHAPDAIILGTGYRAALDLLPEDAVKRIGARSGGPDLHGHSFHPDLPGLAFLGFYNLVGPKLPVLELQARWIAQVLSGDQAWPLQEEMEAGLSEARARRLAGEQPVMHALALAFSRLAGVDPDPSRWPDLEDFLLHGPLSPSGFRLQGPDCCPDAPARLRAEAVACGFGTKRL
ncbi:dimethylaniline monooxygenase [Bosea caraganae]|uniref:Trimethylamine monooxygenase n=1 Tax=Bosea caraganae TaxID=2763117 RepID=A0A370KZE7_9HYPH|nr:FAD-dependent oxidoreductase [Bosea caraganae]RDJ20375.1 dimethylaniline monooxygenase [Bosea caraganae]RDJ26544.1 dimethylaniline monooxygenase [Bosea caraganae]